MSPFTSHPTAELLQCHATSARLVELLDWLSKLDAAQSPHADALRQAITIVEAHEKAELARATAKEAA